MPASVLDTETARIRARETVIGTPYNRPDDPAAAGLLRMVFLIPYGHAYSLMCGGPMGLYDMVNRRDDLPAVAERALAYDSLVGEANRLTVPDGAPYRTIESPAPVAQADIVGVSAIYSGGLHTILRMLDLAGIPRRTADRTPGVHPLVVGGNSGLANPEPLADYLDVVALGDAEESLAELIRILHAHRSRPRTDGPSLHEQLAQVPGLYVPALYEPTFLPGGGVSAMTPRTAHTPARVHAQYLPAHALPAGHVTYPITDGTAAGMHPVLGCRHSCHFCNLGTPPFRQTPLKLLTDYIDRLEEFHVSTVIISAPTVTQYRHRQELLQYLAGYVQRAAAQGRTVTTIIGSIRADEINAEYLDAVATLEGGHLFTELHSSQHRDRGIITIAPEWASPDLVALYGKTMTRQRVDHALDLCRENGGVRTLMLYFIIGAPGERPEDRLAIADYARDARDRLSHPDARVIVKLLQFMPTPNTPTQRLPMTDPDRVRTYGDTIRDRLQQIVGQEQFAHFDVVYGETSRMHLEVVCSRADRRMGHVLEDLFDAGTDLDTATKDTLITALTRRGLDYDRHLRHMDDDVLPWHPTNHVPRTTEDRLATALSRRELQSEPSA
ncbi:radical SAM protein [Streptomyces sp. NEAU-S7GS2]|uniref:B12-binding domain-containing radical SAM protein n=1 Tax=Streptomyces sp. NEAU-S7GS2 TaxID=2202000 RepID=UPI000D6EE2A2|nr:radical SAM protein [Streptomyces sp. NEAU-S7GS2]AWN24826.1 radical SAM protein [Streptomyces sp. NEAU-S7GS2]